MPAAPQTLEATSSDIAVPHEDLANAIRALAMDAVEAAKSGHPGMPMGMADVATVLFRRVLRFDAARPDWPDRDRFVLSAGHGSMLLYGLLYLTGNPDMTLEEIKRFRQLGSLTPGHPEYAHPPGIETTTGPLGQGLGNAVGMALAERILNRRFGDELVDHWTYVVAGDGCLMEGISHEAASFAGHLGLGRLIVLFDDNSISIDGPTSLAVSDDQEARFAALGWHTQNVDGHDPAAIETALIAAKEDPRPSLIACRTEIGFGAPTKAGTAGVHGAPLGAEEIAGARERLGWPHPAFEIPAPVLDAWRAIGRAGAGEAAAWEERLAAADAEARDAFERAKSGALADGWKDALQAHKETLSAERPKIATRVASQQALAALVPALPELIGGSADLTGSNGTLVKAAHKPIARGDFSGNYVHYGVREHGMAAAMNGMALHGGIVPYGGTFLVFTDYCRPSIRLSALMGQRVVYVMTHDSIGLGEDGPTHQPVEHLAALRAIPNLLVMRPADAIETAECWEIALESADRPSVLALTRQGLPTLRRDVSENHCRYGGYIFAPADTRRQATILASGSELEIALQAREKLEAEGIDAAVISMPCWELFLQQPANYRDEVLGVGSVFVSLEAASPFGWSRWVGPEGTAIGLDRFGASAPYQQLYETLGITADAVVEAVKAQL